MAGKLITALNDMPEASKGPKNMIAACIGPSDSTTNRISVGDILDVRLPDPAVAGENKLIGTPNTNGEKLVAISLGRALSISEGSIQADLATNTTPGVVRASGNPISIYNGVINLVPSGITHNSLGGIAADEHINHGNVSLYAGSHIYINNGASNTLKTNSTITVRTVSSPTASRIPETDTTGYLERFVRETIYIKVIPETEPVEGGKKGQFFIPTSLLGKKIISIGLGSYSTSSLGSTISVIFRKTGGSTLVTGTLPPSSDYNESTVVGTIPATGGKAEFYISTGNTNVKGLDAWITVIKQ